MTQSTDDRIRHEAALLYANGETRKAIASLIARINETNGHCSPQIWLCVLDLYQVEQQQAAYEKLAVFFSNRFHFSPPAWKNPQKGQIKQTGQWRNALVVEGSALDIHEDKVRDFVRASKEAAESRIDLSRMRMDEMETVAEQEAKKLLSIMERLRRLRCPTMLMGDTETVRYLKQKTHKDTLSDADKPQDLASHELSPFWMLLFEFYQWRGMEQEFDDLAMAFTKRFDYCPVGYDPSLSIALAPSSHTTGHAFRNPASELSGATSHQEDEAKDIGSLNGLELPDIILDASEMCEWAQKQWDSQLPAEFSLGDVSRIGVEAAQEFTHLLQAQSHPDGITPRDTTFFDVSEIIASLFEVTGLVAFATVQHRYEKLRHLLEV